MSGNKISGNGVGGGDFTGEGWQLMGLVLHVLRAALLFWVAVILLPTAVVEATAPSPHRPAEAALRSLSSTAGVGRDRLGDLETGVRGAENEVRRFAARVGLETERFIARLP